MHRLGFAVKVLGDLDHPPLPSHDARRWRSGPHLSVSLDRLDAILDRLDALDVRMYRMTSDLAPYATHPELPQFHRQVEECAERLAAIGAKARAFDIRLSFHPGQYVVLNSEREDVRALAAREIDVMAAMLDAMGCGPEAVVVLHVGGAVGGREAAFARFEDGLARMGERGRARLVIENDDRSYSVADVVELHRRTGLPVVWDILHHVCHDPERIPVDEALRMALATWPGGVVPKIHWSTGRPEKLRAHADHVDPIAVELFLRGPARGLSFDVMLEAKAKDVALLRLREHLVARGFGWEHGRLGSPAPWTSLSPDRPARSAAS
ncbi:MAG: damage repair endonuclease UvsE [Solirubrobacterales bacterium]|nr:damage repair endonuclease UvsE [Solirubrobacterales bacterium]